MDEKQELAWEQAYLNRVRNYMTETEEKQEETIRVLEEKVDRLHRGSGGTFSQEYELAFNSLDLATKRRRAFNESWEKPYFGRIDFRENLALTPERLYIGKHAIRDNDSVSDFVIDWRAPVANLYYQGTLGRDEYKAPGGFIEGSLSLKRRFAYSKDASPRISEYFDEGDQLLISGETGEGAALQDEFLRLTLEESSTEKLKEIVATIAREQNEIIRAEKNLPIIVQGAAGAGKTTVALHRLAYLLYYYRDTLKGSDVCIIAPNRLFLDYISEVLPDLGSGDVVQTTLEELIQKELTLKKYSWNKDDILRSILEAPPEEAELNASLSRLKGSKSFLALLDAMVIKEEQMRSGHGPILVEGQELYGGAEISRLFSKDLTYLPLDSRLKVIQTYCTRNLKKRLEKVEFAIEGKWAAKIGRIKEIFKEDEASTRREIIRCYWERDEILKALPGNAKKALKGYFKALAEPSALDIYEKFLMDDSFLREHLDVPGVLFHRLMDFSRADIQADDLPALMYLAMKLKGIRHSWSHIVVDEAQDYTLLQLEVIRLMARQDSLTLVGDLAQGIYSFRAIGDWKEAGELFSDGVTQFELRNSYRSSLEIIREANRTLEKMALDLKPAIPVLRHGRKPERRKYSSDAELISHLKEVSRRMAEDARHSLAIVTKTSQEAKEIHIRLKNHFKELELINEHNRVSSLQSVVIPAYMAKGLEFDCVVLADEGSFREDPLDQRLKYVAMTRALHLEYILTKA